MKKLMLSLAVLAVAITTQATTCKWAINTTTAATLDGVVQKGATLYLYQYADANSALAGKQAIAASLRSDKSYDVTGANGFINTFALNTSDGKLNTVAGLSWDSNDTANNFFVALIKADTADGDSYVYFSANAAKKGNSAVEQTLTPVISATTMNGLTAAVSAAPGWFQYAAAPEPTSGLLMLLGFAGLALRRRRA